MPILAPRSEEGKDHVQHAARSAPVLPWMRVPLTFYPGDGILLEDIGGLDPRLRTTLATSGIATLFPVQTAVWEATAGGSVMLHDVCLAAPTGSGKTLAYALPLLQALAKRSLFRLSALVVLPTRDLAMQVLETLRPLGLAVGLRCGSACGSEPLNVEAAALATRNIDVLVATPGRLMAHVEGTPGVDLKHLRFLVIDEADRLLRQSYHGWLSRVLQAATCPRLMKFVVSATLTRDPSKMDRLELRRPRYVALAAEAEDFRHKLPTNLRESKLVVPAERKPYALVALLSKTSRSKTKTIVFASSIEATTRLACMLRFLESLIGTAMEYSASMSPEERKEALNAFRNGRASVLVSSDAMTRGMDVEGVDMVVNYDAPVYVKTYVHRAGRTARAGRSGRVVTLLRKEDARHFKAMLRKVDNSYVKDEDLSKESVEAVREHVDRALEAMPEALLQKDATAAGAPRERGAIEAGTNKSAAGVKRKQSGSKTLVLETEGDSGVRIVHGTKASSKQRKVVGVSEVNL